MIRSRTARRWIAIGAACAASAIAAPGGAQEIRITRPLRGCTPVLVPYSVPTRFEGSYWIAAGGVIDGPARFSGSAYGGVGAEVSAAVLTYIGFPARSAPSGSAYARFRDRVRPHRDGYFGQLRAGAWAQAATRTAGALVEGGATLHIGTVADAMGQLFLAAPWGTFDVRGGGGYGAFRGGRSPFVSVALAWGYRFMTDRTRWASPCDPIPAAVWAGEAKVARFVVSFRQPTQGGAWELGFGLELSPTMATLAAKCSRSGGA